MCQVREVGFRKFWYFTMTSFFVLIVRIKQNKHCGVDAYLIACQNSANDDCLCLSRSQKVNGSLAVLGLEISFPEKSVQQEIRCGAFSNFCDICPGDAIPFSGWFVRARTAPHTFLFTCTETPITLKEFLRLFSATSFAFSRQFCSLPGF